MKQYPTHPFADLFPLHEGPPLWELADDIKKHGLRVAILIFEDMMLDGRRRFLACVRAGVEPHYKVFKGTREEALAFVISANLHRRHLNESERAIVAADIATAKTAIAVSDGGPKTAIAVPTQIDAAKMLNVSVDSVQRAGKVLVDGTLELQAAMKDGTVTVSDAAAIADRPPDVQNTAVAAVRSGKAATAKAAVGAIRVPKNGEVFYDERKIEDLFGKLVREIDQRGFIHGKGKEYDACTADMRQFFEHWQAWRKADSPKKSTVEPTSDDDGVLIPGEAAEAFKNARGINSICHALDVVGQSLDKAARLPGGEMINVTSIKQSLKMVRQTIYQSRATHVCTYCDGKDSECRACKGRFWITRSVWSQSPKIADRRN